MSLHLITGYAGQNHITAADNASFNIGLLGSGNFVLDRGNKFEATIISNNLIRILDGDLIIQGRHVRLAENTYEELMIENGSQGMKRNDLIIARYTKDATTGIENCEFVVLKGAENANAAVDSEYTTGDITEQGNALVTEFPLYRIKINGLNIEDVETLFTIGKTIQGKIDESVAYVKSAVGYTKKNHVIVTAASKTTNGINFTVNSDKSVTVEGTATSRAQLTIASFTLKKDKYVFSQGYLTKSDACLFFKLNYSTGDVYLDFYNHAKGYTAHEVHEDVVVRGEWAHGAGVACSCAAGGV